MEFILDNGSIRVALSTAGGSFTSIKANGREYLWQGDPSVWSGQAPICFPICGGLRNGRAMTMGGREVKLARHGFARKQEWKLEEQGDNMVALSLSSADHAELLEQYPYPFKIVARYTIDSEKVAVSYEVTNEGTEDMPFLWVATPALSARSTRASPMTTMSFVLISVRSLSSVLPFPRRA